jgi:hypothetical protein
MLNTTRSAETMLAVRYSRFTSAELVHRALRTSSNQVRGRLQRPLIPMAGTPLAKRVSVRRTMIRISHATTHPFWEYQGFSQTIRTLPEFHTRPFIDALITVHSPTESVGRR